MSEADHGRLVEVFEACVELPPEERGPYLDRACESDQELRAEIEALLRSDASESGVLDVPALGTHADSLLGSAFESGAEEQGGPLARGQRIGRYLVVRDLGQGAMGQVYLAKQDGTGQFVALKLIRESLVSAKSMRRFRHEAEVLGRLHHPGIARIFEAGSADIGGREQPFFAMEYVRGVTLKEYARGRKLGLRARLSLLAELCDAIHHAHLQGVIHRDLKPDNVLVTPTGEPRVLDFGVARVTDSDVQLTTLHTELYSLIGTLPYMSPEQAGGDPRQIDMRSDVYALGVLAFELLGGVLPLELNSSSLVTSVRVIQEQVPPRLRTLASATPEDVETIVAKALEKEKQRRYQSAAELGEDLRRFLRDEPILARPPSRSYLLRKFTQRNRALVTSLVAVLLVMAIATSVSVYWAVSAGRARDQAEWQSYKSTLVAAAADLGEGSRLTAQERLQAAPERHRGWEWRYLVNKADQSSLVLRGHDYFIWDVAAAPDGSRAYSCAGDATVRVWNLDEAREEQVLRDHGERVFSVAASPDGKRLASGSADLTVRLRAAASLETVAVLEGHEAPIFGLAFSADGALLASGANNGTLRLWDGRSGELLRVLAGHEEWIWALDFSPDGSRLATASVDGTVGVWDVESGDRIATLEGVDEALTSVVFSPWEDRLLCGSLAGTLQSWDLADGSLTTSLAAHPDCIATLAFSPDGLFLLSASRDGTIGVRDGRTLEPITVLEGHTRFVRSVAFSADGSRLVSGSFDNTVRSWPLERLSGTSPEAAQLEVRDFDLGPQPDTLVLLEEGGSATLRDSSSLAPLAALAQLEPGRWFVGSSGQVLADTVAGRPRIRLPRAGQDVELPVGLLRASSPDAQWVAVEAPDEQVGVFSLRGEEPIWLPGSLSGVVFDRAGQRLVVADDDYSIRVWGLRSAVREALLVGHTNVVTDLSFSPSERWLGSASNDGTVRVWDTETWEERVVLTGHGGGATHLAFSPDESRLLVVAQDGGLHVWSVGRWERLLRIRTPGQRPTGILFSGDGARLVCRTQGGALLALDGR